MIDERKELAESLTKKQLAILTWAVWTLRALGWHLVPPRVEGP